MATQSTAPSTVGVRDLHNRTSELIKQVSGGTELAVTVHGKRVARIVPIDENDPLEDLRRRGMIREPTSRKRSVPEPIKLEGGAIVSDLAAEQRR
jgi:prevent-host-death family protein